MKKNKEADDICDTRTVFGNFKGKKSWTSIHRHLELPRLKLTHLAVIDIFTTWSEGSYSSQSQHQVSS